MKKEALQKVTKSLFPVFHQTKMVEDLIAQSQFMDLPAETVLMGIDQIIKVIPLVYSGAVKVIREDTDGNEIFLYYIQAGQSCAMTLSSCLKREKSAVKAIVQENTALLAVPVEVVYQLQLRYPSWNNFILETYSNRFNELLNVVDSVAFQNMDVRLLKYLFIKSTILNSKTIHISNTAIAKDLNSSREVISRLLKQLEQKQILKTSRGKIELLDIPKS
ncbi:MAG: Crp/Fnr family transcriptional regulator [Bacteroidota bacterium]